MEGKKKIEIQKQLCTEILDRAPSILESGDWADCKFVCVETESGSEVVISGHKLVMALASPVFEAMFYGSLAETKDAIRVVDVEPEVFKAMIRYMYTGNLKISSWSEACDIYYAAQKYMLKQLMNECAKYLQNNLAVDNVCQIYQQSLLYEDDALKQECEKVISVNIRDIVKDSSFALTDINIVTNIFSMDTLLLYSEVDLIEAAASYVMAHNTVNNEGMKESNSSISSTMDKLSMSDIAIKYETESLENSPEKQLIRSAVEKIRFLTLTPEQYASCSARFSLLMLQEDYAVVMNIVSDKCRVPMPSGFSTSRDRRTIKMSFYAKLEGFRGYNNVISEPHYFRNLKWQIKLSPTSTLWPDSESVYFSVLCDNETSSNWSCDASVEIRLIALKPGVNSLTYEMQHVFTKKQNEKLPTKNFSVKRDLSNYLENQTIDLEVIIIVNKLVGV